MSQTSARSTLDFSLFAFQVEAKNGSVYCGIFSSCNLNRSLAVCLRYAYKKEDVPGEQPESDRAMKRTEQPTPAAAACTALRLHTDTPCKQKREPSTALYLPSSSKSKSHVCGHLPPPAR